MSTCLNTYCAGIQNTVTEIVVLKDNPGVQDFNSFSDYDNLDQNEIESIATDRKLWRSIVEQCNTHDFDSAGSSQSEET